MTETTQPAADKLSIVGIYLVIASAIIFCLPVLTKSDAAMGAFVLNYCIALTYLALWWGTNAKKNTSILLVLLLISAYSLNKNITIFEDSTQWMVVLLVIYSLAYMLLPYFDKLPYGVRKGISLLLGGAFMLFIYLACYLVPTYPISAFAFFVLGFSLHSFVPAAFIVFTIRRMINLHRQDKMYTRYFFTGIAISTLFSAIFILRWDNVNHIVKRNYNKTLYADNTDLPAWIKVAQNLDDNLMTEKYLKGNLIYTMPTNNIFDLDWGMPHKNLDEVRQHDPLIMLSAIFSPPPTLGESERIKILESMYLSRHHTQDRLWSGENLHTTNIISNIKIWPEQRIAYTEKTITVNNNGNRGRWWNRGEAIYTFHLPEGGVVTSLSLWIDGKEAKGVLTSKHKADSAYKQIVGYENRDPSLVHWQEGNTVSVRVFPVMENENRIFKIGITAPLSAKGKTLAYENIWFEGPGLADASEIRQVEWATMPPGYTMPSDFNQNAAHRFIKEGKYDQEFRLEFNDPGLKPEGFNFGGYTYTAELYNKQREGQQIKKVYLDINNSWTENELTEVYNLVKSHKVYAYSDGLIPLDENVIHQKIITNLLKQRFSMFPLNEVADAQSSIIITKCSKVSPNLADLNGSDFAKKIADKLAVGGRIKLFNLGIELSPYLKGLKEHRSFDYEQGDMELLGKLMATNTFAKHMEDDNHIVIDNAGIMLTRTKDTLKHAGPDHLMRLFAYNHILSQLKTKLFTNAESDSLLVDEAEVANIVTPLSSLIVLESQADYDRFNIAKNQNSLDNATLKSNGAVPEPHEWALIILACVAMIWVKYKEQIKKFRLR